MVTYFDIYWSWYRWFLETMYNTFSPVETEVRALRNCHNINVVRLDRIEKALRDNGI